MLPLHLKYKKYACMPGASHLRHLCKRLQFGSLQNICLFNTVNGYKADNRQLQIRTCASSKSVVVNRPEIGAWRSLVAHLLWEQGAGGSNPLAPTNKIKHLGDQPRCFFILGTTFGAHLILKGRQTGRSNNHRPDGTQNRRPVDLIWD